MKNLVSVRMYAIYKGCTETYIHRLIRDGKLNHEEVSGERRIAVTPEVYDRITKIEHLLTEAKNDRI